MGTYVSNIYGIGLKRAVLTFDPNNVRPNSKIAARSRAWPWGLAGRGWGVVLGGETSPHRC